VERVASGEVGLGRVSGTRPVFEAIMKGNDLVVVGTCFQRGPGDTLSLAKRPILEAKDLVGRRLILPSPVDVRTIEIVLKLNKLAAPRSSIKEAAGKQIAPPEERSYMARLCRAELRREGVTPGPIKFHSEQGAVGFAVENGFFPVGGVASYSSIARQWDKNGDVILWQSAPQPFLPLIAKKTISPAQMAKIREALRGVSADADSPIRKALGITGFDTSEDDRLLKLLAFIEAK
jgi:hypothetical protein